jgi:hypothetical protein
MDEERDAAWWKYKAAHVDTMPPLNAFEHECWSAGYAAGEAAERERWRSESMAFAAGVEQARRECCAEIVAWLRKQRQPPKPHYGDYDYYGWAADQLAAQEPET